MGLAAVIVVGGERAVTRRRSVSSQRNDDLLLDAGSAEIVAVGVDRLGMSGVARRAGLTTGALYSRYENVAELAAAIWTSRVRDQHRALLDTAIRALVERDRSVALDQLLDELRSPSPNTLLALEFLGTARRIDELEEVVLVDVREWLANWRAGPRSRDLRRRAQVIFTLAAVWGVVLHEMPSRRELDWSDVTKSLRWSFKQPYDEPSQPLVPDRVGPVLADTGDASQNALIDSVASIAARVGFERASATRIARRAGLTAGSIYARYRTKEDLLQHAVEILLARRFTDDFIANSYTFSAADPGSATASVVGGYLSPPRREWRRFRIEAQLAARHRRQLALTLDGIQEEAIGGYLDFLGAKTAEERRALDIIARFAQVIPLGLAFVDLVAPGVPGIDWRLVLRPLLSPPSPG
jgi:AcrR family transcriptional regulator